MDIEMLLQGFKNEVKKMVSNETDINNIMRVAVQGDTLTLQNENNQKAAQMLLGRFQEIINQQPEMAKLIELDRIRHKAYALLTEFESGLSEVLPTNQKRLVDEFLLSAKNSIYTARLFDL